MQIHLRWPVVTVTWKSLFGLQEFTCKLCLCLHLYRLSPTFETHNLKTNEPRHDKTINIRPVAGQGSSPETRFSFLKHFRILYPFIPNTIQINQRLCNNWNCKDLTQKNSKSVTLLLRSYTEIGMVLHKILDKALSSHHNWLNPLKALQKKTEIVKHLSQNFYIKILSLWPSGLGMVPHKILDQFLSPCQTWINPSKASQKQTLLKT